MKKLSNRTYTIIFVALFLILISFVLRKVYTEIDELFEPPTEDRQGSISLPELYKFGFALNLVKNAKSLVLRMKGL